MQEISMGTVFFLIPLDVGHFRFCRVDRRFIARLAALWWCIPYFCFSYREWSGLCGAVRRCSSSPVTCLTREQVVCLLLDGSQPVAFWRKNVVILVDSGVGSAVAVSHSTIYTQTWWGSTETLALPHPFLCSCLFPPLNSSLGRPEPHILLFKRPLGTDPVSGKVDPTLEREAKKAYQQELATKMDPGSQVAPMAM